MFSNYFKLALRSLNRYKVYSLLNILGLSLGVASCIIIFLVVKYELGYDKFNKKADRIYRVTLNAIDFNPSVSMVVAPAMRNDFPEISAVSQTWLHQSAVFTVGGQRFREKGMLIADQYFFKMFDYEWIAGDPATALNAPNSIVLTESIAKKYFEDQAAMGQIFRFNNQFDVKVTGIIKDIPGNTHLPFNYVVSFETIKNDVQGLMKHFYSIAGACTYILLPKTTSVESIQKRIPGFIEKNWGKEIAAEARLPLQPLTDIHFDQRYLENFESPTTSRETYWALSIIAIFILLIACINFINMATAQAMRRAKEVGVRKVMGSTRSQLIFQFIGETGVMVFIAVSLGMLIAAMALPKLAALLNLKISFSQLINPVSLFYIIGISLLVILLAGLYPAFVQSSYNPISAFRSHLGKSGAGLILRKSLVVVQFCISQILIIGTLVVAYQMDFFQNRDLGYAKDAVISLDVPDNEKIDLLRQQLTSNSGVKDISFSTGAPVYGRSFGDFSSPELGMTKSDVAEYKSVDERYFDMFKLKMLAGSKIIKRSDKDSANVVINETLMRRLGITDPEKAIGKPLLLWRDRTYISGVVADFVTGSKHKKIRPCVLYYDLSNFYSASVQLQSSNVPQTLAQIEKAWTALFPDRLFSYEFIDEHIATMYRQEQKQYVAFRIFTFIAILIGCLGLYGLVTFAAAQRTKEVGIRKVLGANVADIVFLFSKEFVWLIGIAFIIAAPLAYYVMQGWLNSFAYRINIGASIFLIAIASSVIIAASTIAIQAIRAALVKPTKSLRSE